MKSVCGLRVGTKKTRKKINEKAQRNAVLKLLAKVCFGEMASSFWTVDGLIRWFETDTEGWPPMDGSSGIKILRCDYVEFEAEDMTIEQSSIQ